MFLTILRKDEETGIYASYSPEFDLYSQGMTEEEAIKALEMGIETYLRTTSLIEDVLREKKYV